ncbi:hypothetical protein TNCV_122411 [Trichonephila clavipes]|nr:hypothetical protein TNCV_122411 [Trichonephila clavipes]
MVGGPPRRRILQADVFSRRRLKEISFVERIMDINFCVRLGKSATESYEISKHVEGKESVKDGKLSRSGCPQTSHTAQNIEKVSAVVCNRLQTIAESVGKSSATCQWILIKDLNMRWAELKDMSKMDSRKVSITFTSYGKSVLLLKGLNSEEDVFLQFNWKKISVIDSVRELLNPTMYMVAPGLEHSTRQKQLRPKPRPNDYRGLVLLWSVTLNKE